MRYLLKEWFLLRGWELLPYALVDTRVGRAIFLNDSTFQALSFCDGVFDADNPVLFPIHRQIMAELLKNEIIEEARDQRRLSDFQKYHRFPCRYIATAHWSITGKCNYRCRHCYMSAPDAKYGELSREQCLDVVEQLAQAGIYRVSLTGGEALVRRDFFEIVDALRQKSICIFQIYSNGALINERLLDQLESRGIRPDFSISFDGIGWHDWLRGVEGAEKKALDAFKLLQKRGFPSSVEMCLHRANIHTLEETILVLAGHGVRSVKTSPATDAGEWLNEKGQYTLTAEELCEAYLAFIPKYKAAGAPLSLMLGGSFCCDKGSDKYWIPFKKYDGSEKMVRQTLCRSARTTMYIGADGRLLPCIPLTGSSLQEEMPKITEMGLIQALSESKYLRAIDTRLNELLAHNEKCNACEYRLTCGGGCRAGALFTTGDYLGCDEYTCYFFKNKYEEKIRAIYTE
ncbi:MAG: radical SAM protein [Acidobacteria bacterium]|nr:MAG: radical SAM protein [Acidobacteriota bacterium]